MNFTPKLMPVAEQEGIQIDQLNVLEYENAWTTYQLTRNTNINLL